MKNLKILALLVVLNFSGILCGTISTPPRGCSWSINKTTLIDIEDSLTCKLRTINKAENLFGTLRSYEIEKITNLRLECSDVMFFESSLESVTFVNRMSKLRELTIEYCKIRYVPSLVLSSLRDLRTLNMRTHNNDWSAINLELHPESFRGLTELRNLDLAENNIWSVPTDVFCPLYSLRMLNLTGNRLNDVSQLGFSDWGSNQAGPVKACNTGLETLNLAGNDITVLFDSSFSALRSLEKLLLQKNHLSTLGDHSFAGLQSLQLLNISSNRIKSLSSDLFRTTRKLREIYVQNNTISTLASGLFEGLERLEILDLSYNHLTSVWINQETFTGLIRLVILNLSHNRLTHIDQFVFRELYGLQILHLENNQIETISPNAFSDLKNLIELTLSHNKLKRIESNHFSDLFELKFLFIESNSLEFIHPDAFSDLGRLNDISLNDNLLNEIPTTIKQLAFLSSLDIGKNEIKEIKNSSFEGLTKLTGLRLVDNFITNITANTFDTLPLLHVVNLASNQISFIDRKAFESNPLLKAIRLDDNHIESISEVFTTLSELVWLNISHNKIKTFDYVSLPISVEWLNIGNNLIEDIEDFFKISGKHNLKHIDFSYNRLYMISNSSFPDKCEEINLRGNLIDTIDSHTFFMKENIKKVDLNNNKIKRIDQLSISLSPLVKRNDVPQFYFEKNPLICDCNSLWLQNINDSPFSHYPRISDLNLLTCELEGRRDRLKKNIMEVEPDEFLCQYDTHCDKNCYCCDFDACDCKMTCPDDCSCYHDSLWTKNIVDCGNLGFGNVPEHIPMDVTTLYLDGNDFGDLDSHIFIGKKKLENLYLNSSKITAIHNRTFIGIPSIKILHLEDNEMTALNGYEFKEPSTIMELHLERNLLQDIPNDTFNTLKTLQVLTLNDNKIKNFDPSNVLPNELKNQISITLTGGNLYVCECDMLSNITQWFDIKSIDNIQCIQDNKTIIEFLELCKLSSNFLINSTTNVQTTTLLDDNIYPDFTIITILICSIIILILVLTAFICFFNKKINLWLHSKFGLRLRKANDLPVDKNDDNAKLYDGYVIYSALDSNFIQDEFTNELEHQGYSMCLHHRDIHSMAFLADSLQCAADASKRIIIFISINFLQGEWSDPHFRIALHSTLELIRPSHRRKKLLIILTAPNNIVSTDPIMDILLRTCTVINWGDKKFWEKVKYSMPDTSESPPIIRPEFHMNPVQRYTPAPTTLDMWYRRSCQDQQQTSPHQNDPKTPSQCTYNTEDELSSVSSHYNEPISPQNYNNRASLGHVYSTIPESHSTRCEASYL